MDLAILQAQWQLGELPAEQVPAIALALLDESNIFPALIELATMQGAGYFEIRPVIERTFTEAGLPPISDDEARWRLAYATAAQITSGEITPLDGAAVLWRLCTDLSMPDSLGYFVYLAADYGEGPEDPATEAAWFDAKIVETARELLANRPASEASVTPGRLSPPPRRVRHE